MEPGGASSTTGYVSDYCRRRRADWALAFACESIEVPA